MLDFRYLSFIELSKELNYTTTAKKLFLTQPTITKHIQSIEQELNLKLFEYQNKQLVLTDAGKYLSKELSKILEHIDTIKLTLAHGYKSQSLSIGASHAIGEYYLGGYTVLFQQNDFRYDLIIENPTILLDKLNKGDIDCALISDNLTPKTTLVQRKFYQDNIVLACCSTNKLANQSIVIDDLKRLPLIFREKESGIFNSIMRQLSDLNVATSYFNNVRYIGNIEIVKNLIKNEDFCAFFHEITVKNELNQANGLSTISIDNLSLKQNYYLVYKQNHPKIDCIDKLYTLLQN